MSTNEESRKSLNLAIIQAVAAEKDIEPTDLDYVISDVIDPVALDQLFTSTPDRERNTGCVKFDFCGYNITVNADGTISVQ